MKKVYSVYDKKAMFFSSPMVFDYLPQATRVFENEVKNKNSQLNQYPEDFALYQIAEFDETKGTIIALDTPRHICDAMDYVLPFTDNAPMYENEKLN